MSLKSRGSTRRRENTNENLYPADVSDDVMNGVNGSLILAGKYALYRPRPGRNVSPVIRQIGTDAGHGNTKKKEAESVSKDATCPPASELTFAYENIDKARTSFILTLTLILHDIIHEYSS